MIFNSQDLIILFNSLFETTEETILIGGGDEPLYLPKDERHPVNRIIFRHDYYASALHEIAHWCIAGKARRELIDYGYWYKPDGRSISEQQQFLQVEAKPQALEWIFSLAAGSKFHISQDNLSNAMDNVLEFKQQVHQQVLQYFDHGLPKRAQHFVENLLKFYNRTAIFHRSLLTM